MTKGTRMRRWPLAALVVAATWALAACGSTTNYANDPRPAAPVAVSAAVADGRVTVSPARIGAGPIRLTVANLSRKSLEVLVDPVDASGAGARSGPINPQGTAQLQLQVSQGSYRLKTGRGTFAPATLRVGAKRKSAQNELLLP